MTLKEQFIEYFGEFKAQILVNIPTTKEKHGVFLGIKEEKIIIFYAGFGMKLHWFTNDMQVKKRMLKKIGQVASVKITIPIVNEIVNEICRKIEIEKLEKQMLKETNHLPIAETKLQKF
ncbi:hypothetical protein [Delftia acidovorans]|uniref:hypothetical protein n=1 Tax=Delftia acidovorans TaxID=80866 RepID=UPI0035A0F315